ncbi:hypothetical protein F183_A43060 [Bryobacterales bacterium F-183]|nr:hypothetical protein F183_A43060 [Bryobacterales bacterium F-183]
MKTPILFVLTAAAALAGPPLICQPIEIGNARSLPWTKVQSWNGADPAYNAATSLTQDTLNILQAPSSSLPVRMETMRRAAIYAAKSEQLAEQLTARLIARVADAEAAGRKDPNVWFDAGYFVETLRQVTFIYRYDMLSPAERADWKVRGGKLGLDGKVWIEKAMQMGGKGMEVAMVKVLEYREADLKRQASVR